MVSGVIAGVKIVFFITSREISMKELAPAEETIFLPTDTTHANLLLVKHRIIL